MADASAALERGGLARGAIGLREVLFQAVTSMAPAGAVALSISLGATYAGGALPLAVLLALVGCLMVASSIGQLAKHLPSAGSIYYLRFARSEFNWFLHLVVPVVGILVFLPAWFTALGIGNSVLKFVSPLSDPISETGLIIGIWCAIGVVVLIYLYIRHPARLPKMQQVFADDAVPAAAGTSVGQEGA
jgi:amino acid transporter